MSADELADDILGPDQPTEKESASTVLVNLAMARYEFGVSDTGETFGVPKDGPKVVRMLRGGKVSLRGQLSRDYFKAKGKAAPQQALADALLVVEGFAQDTEEQQLHLRVARHGDALWLDLGDVTGQAVQITRDGWSIQDTAPVLFKRTPLNAALPAPESGGRLSELWEWLNVAPSDRPLVAGWLVSVLFCDIPHPVLGLFGEQGTAKTTAEKVLTLTLDPSPVPARKPPRDAESWVTAASGSWVVGLDNLSDIPPWLSDTLCRAVTGDGDVRRKLYTDGDLAVFSFRRCIILTGIDIGASAGDFAERMLPIGLEIIKQDNRREEKEMWPAWNKAHPRILGAVLDLAVSVLAEMSSVHLPSKPRMADFARIVAAVDKVLGTSGLKLYLTKQRNLATDSLTGDLFVMALKEKLCGKQYSGTSAELLGLVTPTDEKWRAPKGWPGNARAVTQLLTRQAVAMRKAGWTVESDDGSNHDKVARWTLGLPREARIPDPQDPRDPQDPPSAGHAGHAGHEYGPSQDDGPTRDTDDGFCAECQAVIPPTAWGPCARQCGARIHRYGNGHGTLCSACRTTTKESAA